jgi:hypothetical protein
MVDSKGFRSALKLIVFILGFMLSLPAGAEEVVPAD